MSAERRHLGLHVGMQRQETPGSREARRALDPEDADVRPLADDAPEMEPFALTLQLGRTFVLERAEPFDSSGSAPVRRPDSDEDVRTARLIP